MHRPQARHRRAAEPDEVKHVQILVRVRPFSETESASGKASALTVLKDNQISLMPHAENSLFAFDGVLEGSTTQAQVFEGAPPPGTAPCRSCEHCGSACRH